MSRIPSLSGMMRDEQRLQREESQQTPSQRADADLQRRYPHLPLNLAKQADAIKLPDGGSRRAATPAEEEALKYMTPSQAALTRAIRMPA